MRKMSYQEMVAAGLCVVCGVKSETKTCQPCRDKRNEHRKEVYRYKKLIGRCKWCSNDAEPNKQLCYECLGKARDKYHASGKKKSNEKKMQTYYERKEQGICTRCGKKPKEKGQLCARCYAKVKVDKYAGICDISRSERPSYGMCYICGEPKMTDRNVCESCYEVRKQTIPAMLAVTNNSYYKKLNGMVFNGAR